jgi:hypothetical protein
METYTETVLRYRVMRHTKYPKAHEAEMRIKGMDPDNMWALVWSFNDLADAEETLRIEKANAMSYETWKVVDGGEDITIDRPVY